MESGASSAQWIFYLSCAAFFVLPMGTTPFTIIGFCILSVWVFSGEFIRVGKNCLRVAWFLPVLAAVTLIWSGLIWSPEPAGLGFRYASKTYYWLYALALASIASLKRPREYLVKAFLGGLLLNTFVGFLQLADMIPRFSDWGSRGYSGFNGGYNTLGILLVLGMMAGSYYYRTGVRREQKTVYAFLILAYFCHLIILESRGGYLTFILLSPIIFNNIFQGKRFIWILVACVIALGSMYSSPIVRHRMNQANQDLHHHLNSTGGDNWGEKYSKHMDRIYMWRWAIKLFGQNPLLGVGTGGYRQAVLSAGGNAAIDHPHSNFLYVAASFGMVGLFIFGWLFWVLLKTGWKNRENAIGFFVLAATLVLLVGGLTETHILDSGGAFLLAVTTGLQSSVEQRTPGKDSEVFEMRGASRYSFGNRGVPYGK